MLFLVLAWRYGSFSLLSKILSVFLYAEFWHGPRPICSWRCLIQNWFSYSLLLLTEGAPTSALGFQPIIWLLSSSIPCQAICLGYYMSLYPFLYPSGHKVQTSVGFPSDLDLLLQDWPTLLSLLTVILWQLANSNTRIVEIPYFSSLSGRPRDNNH